MVRMPKRHEWPAEWLEGEVRRHCAHCMAPVERADRICPRCSAALLKECPCCHYWVLMDTSYCVSCRHGFPLPLPPRTVVRLWHPKGVEEDGSPEAVEPEGVGDDPQGNPQVADEDGHP
jgi:hypothetical protein